MKMAPHMLPVADVAERRRRAMTIEELVLFGVEKLNVPRSKILAATHVDYSARVQTVHRVAILRFHALISEFWAITGSPALVNTNFNVRGDLIVCTPQDACRWFNSGPGHHSFQCRRERSGAAFAGLGSVSPGRPRPAAYEPCGWYGLGRLG